MKSKRLLKNAVAFLSVIVLALIAAVCVQGYTVSAEENEEVYTTDDGKFDYVVVGNTIKIKKYNIYDSSSTVVPATIDGKPVTAIGEEAFCGHTELSDIDLPDSITSIGAWAFSRTSYMIEIPKGVTTIEEGTYYMVYNNGGLLEIPSNVKHIGKSAFLDCQNYTSIKLNEGLQTIGEKAFYNNDNVESIVIPKSVTSIGDEAFRYFGGLKKIEIYDGVTSIGDNAFECCFQLTIYTYKDSYADKWATEKGIPVVYMDKNAPSIPEVDVTYHTHIQTYGDTQGTKKNGQMAGTSGESKRLENIWIKVDGNPNLGVQYSTHCQTYGWMPWSCNGETNGTSGEAKRLEAIKIQLTGADKDKYDIYYRVHAQSYGWLGWAKNGGPSGTAGYAKRLEGIQVVVVKKGEAAPGLKYAGVDGSSSKYSSQPYVDKNNAAIVIPGDVNAPIVSYKTHVQSFGWQKWVYNGAMSGTEGKAKRLEGINIKVTNCPYDGDIVYTTHVQKYGWKDGKPEDASRASWKKNGEMSGTSGEAKRLEAICIDLTGQMGEKYDIYYRVHAQSFGWLGWAKNGEESGTAGYAKRLEGIQIVLVPKGGTAPADNYGGIKAQEVRPFIEKK